MWTTWTIRGESDSPSGVSRLGYDFQVRIGNGAIKDDALYVSGDGKN